MENSGGHSEIQNIISTIGTKQKVEKVFYCSNILTFYEKYFKIHTDYKFQCV